MSADDSAEAPRVRGREIALFAIFGVLPFVAIYLFAAAAGDDPRGRAFEAERRALISACADRERERDACRTSIDAAVHACFARFADARGVVAERQEFVACVERGPADGSAAP